MNALRELIERSGGLRIAAVVAALGVLAVLLVTGSANEVVRASHSGGPDLMSIDMDPEGNTATSLSFREPCQRINENNSLDADEESTDTLDIDITVTDIPVTNRMQAFQYFLNYSAANLNVSAKAHNFLIEAAGGSAVDFSDAVPDTDGSFAGAVFDFSVNYESGNGVLSRLGLTSNPAATPGVYTLMLTPDSSEDAGDGSMVFDEFAGAQSPDAIEDATVAIGVPCGTQAVYTVDTTADAVLTACTGAASDCSLRGAITNAAGSASVETIIFAPAVFPPSTQAGTAITLGSPLPALSNSGDTIDGTAAGVAIAGGGVDPCFTVSGDDNDIVSLRSITGCDTAIEISGGGGNLVGYINGGEVGAGVCSDGVDQQSDGFVNDGCGASGAPEIGADCNDGLDNDGDVLINDGCPARGQGIRISGNSEEGILITGESADTNLVLGNFIGLDDTLNAAAANYTGVLVANGADSNIIGGFNQNDDNVISGNTNWGIGVTSSTATGNLIVSNYIGTNAAGTAAVANVTGVALWAPGNTVGWTNASGANVISGNPYAGVEVYSDDADGNDIQGNVIGLNAAGTAAIGNGDGIVINGSADSNVVGGMTAGERNTISGNSGGGVFIGEAGTTANTVIGNYIGVAADGTTALGNGGDGVEISAGASGNTIGSAKAPDGNCTDALDNDGDGFINDGCNAVTQPPEVAADCADSVDDDSDTRVNDGCPSRGGDNVITDSGAWGVLIDGSGTNGNAVTGNFIGSDANWSTGAIANTSGGVRISGGAQSNTIGGSADGSYNSFLANTGPGLEITGATSSGNVVKYNNFGATPCNCSTMANTGGGVVISSPSNTIGSSVITERNSIMGNTGAGITITGASATGNVVKGNLIGNDGNSGFPNTGSGIVLSGGASGNTIGGTAAGDRNTISGNSDDGIDISGVGTSSNVVIGNHIGTSYDGVSDLGNSDDGVRISGGATGNTVGGSASGSRNVISGNAGYGVAFLGGGTSGNFVRGNYIGTNAAGTGGIANNLSGVGLVAAAGANTIGGTSGTTPGGSCTGDCNLLSGNDQRGIDLVGVSGWVIQGNYIGTNANGTSPINNDAGGVVLNSGTTGTTVGGTTAAARNLISGNLGSGVGIANTSTSNTIQGNYIGTNAAGTGALANIGDGIQIHSDSDNNVIGGVSAGQANLIAFNDDNGVCILQAGTPPSGVSVRGNSIHSNSNLGIDLAPAPSLCTDGAVTPNDGGDGDTGPNNLMNFPMISTVTYNAGTRAFAVTGTLDTASPDTATVDVYSTDTPDGSGNGEGQQYLGSATPSGGGAWTFNGTGTPQGGYITATATKTADGTSEFSLASDSDVDGDGLVSSADNCDVVFNPFQIDHDADSVGDTCDSDVGNRFTAAQSSLSTSFTVVAGDQLPDETRVIAPWDFQSGAGGPAADIGSQVGEWDLSFGLKSATACDLGFSQANIKLLAASVDNSPGNLVTTANILADTDGDTIVDGVEGYPAFLNTFYDPERRANINEDGDGSTDEDGPDGADNDLPTDGRVDEDGAGTPPAPHARYFGRYNAGYFQVVVWEEDPDDRYRMETIFNDPTGFPNGVSCAPLEVAQTIYTTSVLNTDPNPDVSGGEAVLVDPASGSGTRVVRAQGVDRADADGDLQDNWVDNCKLIANATQADGDSDGIGDACDPTPAVNTGPNDHDGDGIGNVVDNCPTTSNASQAEGEVRTPRTFGLPSVDDAIGDACDPNPLRVDDVHVTSNPNLGRERRGVHINEYSDPICITGGGVLDTDGDGWCAANDPDDSLATGATKQPENESLVLPAGTGTFSRGLCNNGINDDDDDEPDFDDDLCGDQDGDFIPDNVDICDLASDPLQLDADADGTGDACETAAISDLDVVTDTNGANSELRSRLVEVAPLPLHRSDGIMHLIDSETDGTSDWGVATGAAVPDGAIWASLTTFMTVGIDPTPELHVVGRKPCNSVVPMNFTLLDASTNPAATVDPGTGFAGLTADTDADGLVNGVESYPSFLRNLQVASLRLETDGDAAIDEDPVDGIDNDQDGSLDEDGYDPATPRARLFGYTNFQGATRVLNILIFSPGTVPAIPATMGYAALMVFDDPSAYTSSGNVVTSCSHQDHRLSLYGVSVDYPGTVANEGGTNLSTNDSVAITERFFTRVTSIPDADGDGIENGLDVCVTDADNDEDSVPDQSDATPWNPRLLISPGDPDDDGLPNKCDPDDLVPSPPGSLSDQDGDDIMNTADNCPLVANPLQTDSDGDRIGDACDNAASGTQGPFVPDGTAQAIENGTPVCTSTNPADDSDDDNFCEDIDPDDDDDSLVREASAYGPQLCRNSNDDDDDTFVDLLDSGCGDADADGVLNNQDNCLYTKNGPAQAGILGVGNQANFDGSSETITEQFGAQPFARTSDDPNSPSTDPPSNVQGAPFARTQNFGGDACDPDDDNDGLADASECDEYTDGDTPVNDGCVQANQFSEADVSGGCSNSVDEADEDPNTGGAQDDDNIINDGCPVQGAGSEDVCRRDSDCENDYIGDLAEWKWPCLNIGTPITPDANRHDEVYAVPPASNDIVFTYGEALIGTDPCTNTNNATDTNGSEPPNFTGEFEDDPDGDGIATGRELFLGTDPADNCGPGTITTQDPNGDQSPSNSWPADLSRATSFSRNKLNVQDLGAFVSPTRRLNITVQNTLYSRRFDFLPGAGVTSTSINVQDLSYLTTLYPPMFAPNRAFNYLTPCTP